MNFISSIDSRISDTLQSHSDVLNKDPNYHSLVEANENFKRMVKEGLIIPRESKAKSIMDVQLVSFKINGK